MRPPDQDRSEHGKGRDVPKGEVDSFRPEDRERTDRDADPVSRRILDSELPGNPRRPGTAIALRGIVGDRRARTWGARWPERWFAPASMTRIFSRGPNG